MVLVSCRIRFLGENVLRKLSAWRASSRGSRGRSCSQWTVLVVVEGGPLRMCTELELGAFSSVIVRNGPGVLCGFRSMRMDKLPNWYTPDGVERAVATSLNARKFV